MSRAHYIRRWASCKINCSNVKFRASEYVQLQPRMGQRVNRPQIYERIILRKFFYLHPPGRNNDAQGLTKLWRKKKKKHDICIFKKKIQLREKGEMAADSCSTASYNSIVLSWPFGLNICHVPIFAHIALYTLSWGGGYGLGSTRWVQDFRMTDYRKCHC